MSENKRIESARAHDDSALIDDTEKLTGQSGVSGGNLQRKIAARAEEHLDVGDDQGVERVHARDKKEEANLPRYNER